MQKKINIGVIGCANIAERYILPTILEMPDMYRLIGTASRNSGKAEKFASKFNATPYADYQDLIGAEHLDAVYIPLPNQLHYEWIKKSLDHGLHVLVEKSLACTGKEVVELNQMAREKSLVLMENFQFRFHSQLQFIQDLLVQGVIGELRSVRSAFGFPPFPDKENIRYSKRLGGGALLDAGAYPIKISQLFLGEEISIDAANLYFDKEKGVDIWGSAYVKQNNGSLASQIAFGFDNYYQCNLELWGSKGKLYTNRIFTAAPGFEPLVEVETAAGRETLTLAQDHHFKKMLGHFYQLIATGVGLDDEYRQNITQARLINELRLSAKA